MKSGKLILYFLFLAEGRGQTAEGRNIFAFSFRLWALGLDRNAFISAFCLSHNTTSAPFLTHYPKKA
jgi:hypothetical protein